VLESLYSRRKSFETWAILLLILVAAGGLRWVGINWDDYNHSHPDELFLTTIASEISEQSSLLDEVKERCADRPDRYSYFNTRCSPLNPNNIEEGSYAYGTLPTFLVRATAELAVKLTGDQIWLEFDGINLVGRFVNIVADLIAVIFVFLTGRALFGDKNGLLAAMLYAGAVLPIQLTHFWTVDIIAHTWFLIALYAAVQISQRGRAWAYILLGIALGAGVASRVNVLAGAALAPAAALVWLRWRVNDRRLVGRVVLLLLVAAGVSFVTFRLAQPYAFKGPNWWNIDLNSKWLEDVSDVSEMSAIQQDGWPPSHQFVGRLAYLYPWFNMAMWGMGLLLGLGATLAFITALIQQIRRRQFSAQVGLFTLWIVLYFGWFGRLHFATMRYYLPLYGVLCLLLVWWLQKWRLARLGRILAVVGTFVWAFAFTGIYRSSQTRADAAEWITKQMPAAITGIDANGNWHYFTPDHEQRLQLVTFFKPEVGPLPETYGSNRTAVSSEDGLTLRQLWFTWVEPTTIDVIVQLFRFDGEEREPEPLLDVHVVSEEKHQLRFDLAEADQITLEEGTYQWTLAVKWPDESLDRLHMISAVQWSSPEREAALSPIRFGEVTIPVVPYAYPSDLVATTYTLEQDAILTGLFIPHNIGTPGDLTLTVNDGPKFTAHFVRSDGSDSILGDGRWYEFDDPVSLTTDPILIASVEPLWIAGTTIATEGDWDYSTPTRSCFRPAGTPLGYHPLEGCKNSTGFDTHWYSELPLQVVEHDSPIKWRYMLDTLLKADYLTISSNRMYDALPRIDRLYPSMRQFYADLFDKKLGYEQVARFVSQPHIGPLTLPDQVLPDWNLPGWLNELEAEEAFTVYDHPTVYVFQNHGFSPDKMPPLVLANDERNRVDLDKVAQPTYTASQSEPSETQIWLVVVGWAVVFILLGWLAFPLMFTLFPSLPLRGFGFGRGVAWLVLSIVPWWLTAQFHLPFWTRTALFAFVILFVALNIFLFRQRSPELRMFIRDHWRAMLAMDVLWLAAFGFGIVLRAVDPDYWHYWMGGEKPMDTAYLNAVWRAGEFPPPNPWMSGYTINYYYLGFVIAALPLKLLRIAPEIAPNLMLATIYGTVFVQVFNLVLAALRNARGRWAILLAGVGVIFVMVAGNLGTLSLILKPEPDMAAHRWYWYPTRVIGESANGGGAAINEVPLFAFLYGDLHAHSINLLPVTLLLMTLWAFVHQRRWWFAPVIGALVGVIYMTNTWDILVYVPLVILVVVFMGRHKGRFVPLTVLMILAGAILVWPYVQHSAFSEYGGLERWKQERSLLDAFLLAWGAPLGVLALWMSNRVKLVVTPDADAPVEIGLLILLALPAVMVGGQDGTTVLLVMLLAGALALAWFDVSARAVHLAEAFFLAGLLATEHIVVVGDIGRMNTTFKVSYQLWLWIGLLMPVMIYRLVKDRKAYLQAALCGLLLLPGLLQPIKAIPAREEDTFAPYFSLNGYLFLDHISISTSTSAFNLSEDAALIRYMRANIQGYPVIAEMYDHEYYWNTRIASHTGLPTVIGWQGHLLQQYRRYEPEIRQRVLDMGLFYITTNPDVLLALIQKYDIEYIVYGRLEQSVMGGLQNDVFDQLVGSGKLSIAYETGRTRLYHVETAVSR
jgi:YYY domain-containing protein